MYSVDKNKNDYKLKKKNKKVKGPPGKLFLRVSCPGVTGRV